MASNYGSRTPETLLVEVNVSQQIRRYFGHFIHDVETSTAKHGRIDGRTAEGYVVGLNPCIIFGKLFSPKDVTEIPRPQRLGCTETTINDSVLLAVSQPWSKSHKREALLDPNSYSVACE